AAAASSASSRPSSRCLPTSLNGRERVASDLAWPRSADPCSCATGASLNPDHDSVQSPVSTRGWGMSMPRAWTCTVAGHDGWSVDDARAESVPVGVLSQGAVPRHTWTSYWLLPHLQDASDELAGRDRALATARHFRDHRSFYRAMLTGSCAFALNEALNGLFHPLNRQFATWLLGEGHQPEAADDLATFLTGGGAAIFNSWLIEGEHPLDPEHFADRLMRTLSVLAGAASEPTTP